MSPQILIYLIEPCRQVRKQACELSRHSPYASELEYVCLCASTQQSIRFICAWLKANAQILIYLILPPPKSSHFVSVVLCTSDFVGIAPEKVNTHFVRASFFLERDKFKFIELISFSILHLIYNFYLNFSIPLCVYLSHLLCVLFFYPTLQKYFLC